MLEALQERALCVCELTALVKAGQSTVSKHLAMLKAAGLVEDRKRGTNIFYRLKCRCLQDLFSCIESVLRANLKAQQEALASK